MKKLTFYILLLQGLLLGIMGDRAKSLAANSVDPTINQGQSEKSQVWTIDKNKQVKRQPYNWVVKDTKNTFQQPLLLVEKPPEKPSKNPPNAPKGPKRDELEAFDEVTKDTRKIEGLFTLYRQKEKNKIFLEIKPEQLNKNFLATATLESGIGEAGIYSGMPLQDFLFYFQRQNNNLYFAVRNVNFRTKDGDPQARSLARSFSDSILYTIPIKSIHPERKTLLIDLGDLLLTDLAGLYSALGVPGGADQGHFGGAKAFPQNVEIESVFNFAGGGAGATGGPSRDNPMLSFMSLPDSRGFTLRVHYSLSQLSENNYTPRLADERIGYFITAYQNISSDDERGDPFVRYVNRWNLEKQDPKAALSPPKKPIVFWIDNAVPYEYRDAIKEGVLMWNRAFEAAGFKDAIQVKQMPDNATWDPSDIRYNTIRWINTVDGYFAMGPFRVNPMTGEILDADILVDASFIRALKSEYRKIVQPNANATQMRSSVMALMRNGNLCANGMSKPGLKQQKEDQGFLRRLSKLAGEYDLCYGAESAQQFAFGTLALSLLQNTMPSGEETKRYIHEYLRLIIAHEVGHTLGLRHNFRGSTLLQPEQLNNQEVTHTRGLTTSVMDYIPPNIAPPGVKQGEYFPGKIGPYDMWAVRYGYTPTGAQTPIAEKSFLQQIAAESDKPELSYSTDEDMFDLDPYVNAWDHSGNVLLYSQWQLENARVMWDKLNKRYPIAGESYSDVNDRFEVVLLQYLRNLFFTTQYIGGQSFYRVAPGERRGRYPFEAVSLDEQRHALANLQKYVFAEDAFNFPPELLNKLAPARWRHWGTFPQMGRLDFPVHNVTLAFQGAVLRTVLSGDRLTRLKDIEYKNPNKQVLTLPELFDTLQNGVWTEVVKPKGKVKISSMRRGLQREYLDTLTAMVLRKDDEWDRVPEDARTLAWYKLRQLREKIASVDSDDEYTKAHLLETKDRIEKTLNAPIQSN